MDFMKRIIPIMRAGNVAKSIRLNSQHLKKAKKMAATLVTVVEMRRLIFSPVAVSMAVIPVATLVTSL